ncbi:MAG: DUF4369 domain-containing protein [Alloprevotella sp.]|nr:DUF4369 domain-containing protein [Alloprevotella sp.]
MSGRFTHYVCAALLLTLASCAEEYKIAGKSTVPVLDGKVLTLRSASTSGAGQVDLDSCMVIHGKFSFYGDVDTVCMAQIYMGGETIMPLVIETGDLHVSLDNLGQRVSGGPMNNRLYKYINQQRRLYNEWNDLQSQYIQLVMSGTPPGAIQRKLDAKFRKNAQKSEELETKFIIDNADNVLGPGCFKMLCDQYPFPVLTDQINTILTSVPAAFLQDPYVRNYIRQARLNPQSRPCKLPVR